MREVWITCYGVPLHARCPNTFISIGQHWGEVLRVDFDSWENGATDNGRILILSNVVAAINSGFKSKVDGFVFDCWVVEGCSMEMSTQDHRPDKMDHGIHGSVHDAWDAMDNAGEMRKPPDSYVLSSLDDGDRTSGASSVQSSSSGDGGCYVDPLYVLIAVEGLETF
ncbi:hypothetical protein Dimus_025666 [Dionaea muscipula]